MSDRSGDFCGIGLVVYELVGKLSRAFSSSAFAAFAIAADVFGRIERLGEPGFSGRGGGARSGSELSHLRERNLGVSGMISTRLGECNCQNSGSTTYIGIWILPSDEKECECRTSSRSREPSLSIDGILCRPGQIQTKRVVVE